MYTVILIVVVIFIIYFIIKNNDSPSKLDIDSQNRGQKMAVLSELQSALEGLNSSGTTEDMMPQGYGEFGLEVTNPIPVNTILGSAVYLDKLRTIEGNKITYRRIGSVSAKNISSVIDSYEISTNDKHVATIFICPYNKKNSEKAPKGFKLTI